jgi:hypothetical protein
MTVPEQVYREFARRGHRLLGAYLAIYAWTHELDCIAIDRKEMLAFWGLRRRVEERRLTWLKQDISQYFLQVRVLRFSNGGSFASIFLSRRVLPFHAFDGSMSDEKRVALLTSLKAPAVVVKLPTESEMLRILTSVSDGLAEFPVDEGT